MCAPAAINAATGMPLDYGCDVVRVWPSFEATFARGSIMKKMVTITVAALLSLSMVSGIASAQGQAQTEVSLMGGFQVLNENDTALPDNFVNIPAVATVSYGLSPLLALEGEFTWMIPVKQDVNVEPGPSQKLKSPDILAYQANLRANWTVTPVWSPYLAGGLGAMTVLSNTDADRFPQVSESETMFAINFGGGMSYALSPSWALRGDFREFVGFPSDNATGLSDATGADPIWMERGAVGIAYRF